MSSTWFRVSRTRRCEICNKPDWCTYTDDGASCCMRVESQKKMSNRGWLHRSESIKPLPIREARIEKPTPPPNWSELVTRWRSSTSTARLITLAESLGVDPIALDLLTVSWAKEHDAWSFPMRDASGNLIGVRLRSPMGDKWAVKGSKNGLFTATMTAKPTLFVCEGATDAAAMLTMGFFAIGRPNCSANPEMIVDFVRHNRVRRVVIIPDNDEHGAGQIGANELQAMLRVPSLQWMPSTKDVREFLKAGGDAELITGTIKDLAWEIPK